jgi:NADH:ubiquinone oxidoreductase subunit 6 (subunit J)
VLALVVHLISLAALFLLLRAEFVAAVQVVVYAGAVMVLYVFVVAYVGEESASIGERLRSAGGAMARTRTLAALVGAALATELLVALLGTGLKAIDSYGAPYRSGPKAFGTPGYIGELLLTRFLIVFEVASFLLLVAAVGAVVLARRRGGLGEEEPAHLTPLNIFRPLGTGTMAESVEGRMPIAEPAEAAEEHQDREPEAAQAR